MCADVCAETGLGADPVTVVATLERLAALTLKRLGPWLDHSTVRAVPVIDLAATSRTDPALGVDVHDPPEATRELVILRDRHCVFPWLRREALVDRAEVRDLRRQPIAVGW